jgi:thiopeptide-type bacteriocin biosynthesis protein
MPEAGLVYDHEGMSYINQFVASLYNTERSYSSTVHDLIPNKERVERAFLPGDKWLYFKIYCHSHTADRILTEEVASIIKKLKRQKLISTWFFIRYYDPDHHIRFRIRMNHLDSCGKIISEVNHHFGELKKRGSLTNIVIDSYCREIERYGFNSIEQIEQIFNRSSEIVLNFLKSATENQDLNRLNLAVLSIDDVFNMLQLPPPERINLLEIMYSGLLDEFRGGKKGKVEMDGKYRRLSRDMVFFFKHRSSILNLTGRKNYQAFKTELSLFEKQIQMVSQEQKQGLIGDIIHTHLNRIFPTNQRKNEMVVYYLLAKYYKSMIARETKAKYSPAA